MLQKELDEANLSELPTYEKTLRLPILQACIKETYRFHTPVGVGLSRISPPQSVVVCGRFFKPGTITSVNPWAIHPMTSLFGADASKFNLQRWLDPKRSKKVAPFMIAFGAGCNQCTGRHLAHPEVSKTTAILMRDIEIELVDKEKEWRYETYFTVAPHNWPCLVKRRFRESRS
jgi:cytochrome P450